MDKPLTISEQIEIKKRQIGGKLLEISRIQAGQRSRHTITKLQDDIRRIEGEVRDLIAQAWGAGR